jgi:hypothetical protein
MAGSRPFYESSRFQVVSREEEEKRIAKIKKARNAPIIATGLEPISSGQFIKF